MVTKAQEREYVDRTCVTCSSTFQVQYQSVMKGNGLYCKRSCNPNFASAHAARRKNPLGATNFLIDRVCKTCGAEFSTKVKNVNRGGGEYCSNACVPRERKTEEEKKESRRAYNLRVNYGLTPLAFEKLLESQGGVCAICGKPQTSKLSEHLFVDHDHVSGKVRGLLCGLCNTAIGMMRDCPDRFKKAMTYLDL